MTYTPIQLEDFFHTLVAMQERGVVFEPHAKNLLYNPSTGFTPIDYCIMPDPQIDLGEILNILSLRAIPKKREGNRPVPINGLCKENHPDVESMVYDAFRKVNPIMAEKKIAEVESMKKSWKTIYEELKNSTNLGGYSQLEESKFLRVPSDLGEISDLVRLQLNSNFRYKL